MTETMYRRWNEYIYAPDQLAAEEISRRDRQEACAPCSSEAADEPREQVKKPQTENERLRISALAAAVDYVDLKGENEELRKANIDCVDHFNALKADYDALRAVLAKQGWQPIETAPKDGTRVLIRADCVVVAGWENIFDNTWGWTVVNDTWVEGHMATHWMPLPQAPKEQTP
jgi:hypothetical protein